MSDIQYDIFGGQIEVNDPTLTLPLVRGGLPARRISAGGGRVNKSDFNIFSLTDAIGARKKKDAWILYQKAMASGMVADDIFWRAIAWEIKTLLLASKTSSAEESGFNPFVYQKAKAYSKNFKPGELEQISENLVVGYHNARRGIGEIETLIEKMLLSL